MRYLDAAVLFDAYLALARFRGSDPSLWAQWMPALTRALFYFLRFLSASAPRLRPCPAESDHAVPGVRIITNSIKFVRYIVDLVYLMHVSWCRLRLRIEQRSILNRIGQLGLLDDHRLMHKIQAHARALFGSRGDLIVAWRLFLSPSCRRLYYSVSRHAPLARHVGS